MTTLSTHVLDLEKGEPASGLEVTLKVWSGSGWNAVGSGATDGDGRLDLGTIAPGRYRLSFETGAYGNGFYPYVPVVFEIDATREHYHVPLLLSPFGYSTYRGS